MDPDETEHRRRRVDESVGRLSEDHLPGIFRANTSRFYRWVVVETLQRLQPHADIKLGGADSRKEFAENLQRSIFNQVAQEARRAFAVTLGSTFERQVRRWFGQFLVESERHQMWREQFLIVFPRACERCGVDLKSSELEALIRELILLVNVLRHGEGRSVKALFEAAPHLWDHFTPYDLDTSWEFDLMSEGIGVQDVHLARYAWALEEFWKLADPRRAQHESGPFKR